MIDCLRAIAAAIQKLHSLFIFMNPNEINNAQR